jgi:hypothetical protein
VHNSGLLVNNSVESVDGVGGVVNNTTAAVGLNKGVRSRDNISVAALVLFLVVAGQGISNGVGVAEFLGIFSAFLFPI